MKEFATANDNMVAFNYMPGYSAVSAAMQEAADKAADGSGKVADVFLWPSRPPSTPSRTTACP